MARQSRPVRAWMTFLLVAPACGGEDRTGPPVPTAIVIVPDEPRVVTGSTLQLTATVVDAEGQTIQGQPLAFSSSDPGVLTVSNQGLLAAPGPLGSADMEVVSGQLTAQVTASVMRPSSAILVEPRSVTLGRGTFITLLVTSPTIRATRWTAP